MKDISDYDDSVAASLLIQVRDLMHEVPTQTKIKVCFNWMCGLAKICSICCDKETVENLANEFHKGLMSQIEEMYD